MCAVAATGGAAPSRAPWSVQEETSCPDAMCVRAATNENMFPSEMKKGQLLHTLFLSLTQGDSGGPLNCLGKDGRWYIQGVTSFVSTRVCNEVKKPTVFTRTSAFTDWLSDVSSSADSV